MESTVQRSRARRCLFGKPDPDALRKDLDQQLSIATSCFKSTWNFNPENDEPTEGRLDWEAVPASSVPEFYIRDYKPKLVARRRLQRSECETDSLEITTCQTPPASPERFVPVSSAEESEEDRIENMRRVNETTPEARIVPATRQSHINDFMQVKKRRLSDEEVRPATPRKMPRL